jgi:hypothetical protein
MEMARVTAGEWVSKIHGRPPPMRGVPDKAVFRDFIASSRYPGKIRDPGCVPQSFLAESRKI